MGHAAMRQGHVVFGASAVATAPDGGSIGGSATESVQRSRTDHDNAIQINSADTTGRGHGHGLGSGGGPDGGGNSGGVGSDRLDECCPCWT